MDALTLHISIDKTNKVPIFRQIYQKLRDDILTGRLIPGTRLPSTRILASDLGVSRNVVVEAYDQLYAEGYTISRQGSYTKVAPHTHYRSYKRVKPGNKKPLANPKKHAISFETGLPELKSFPSQKWGAYLKQAALTTEPHKLAYHRPEGLYQLRETLADYLYKRRGIQVNPNSIVITSGATQALTLAGKILFSANAQAVVEDPGGYAAIEILRNAGFTLNPVKTGPEGIELDSLNLARRTRFVYVTPSHQFPMGSIMPAAKRIGLLEAVSKRDIYIIEDDYDSEYRYDGAPILPLKALDPEKVIYIGSFSKVLSPALRIGYAIVPVHLLDRFKTAKKFSDGGSPMIEQSALNLFIRDGSFEKHVFKMGKMYEKKRNVLIESLKAGFDGSITIFGENAGLHLVAKINKSGVRIDNDGYLRTDGIVIPSVERHAVYKGKYEDHLVFGYGNLDTGQIRTGVKRLVRELT